MNPECRDGKHDNCSGTGIDLDLDIFTACPCECHGNEPKGTEFTRS